MTASREILSKCHWVHVTLFKLHQWPSFSLTVKSSGLAIAIKRPYVFWPSNVGDYVSYHFAFLSCCVSVVQVLFPLFFGYNVNNATSSSLHLPCFFLGMLFTQIVLALWLHMSFSNTAPLEAISNYTVRNIPFSIYLTLFASFCFLCCSIYSLYCFIYVYFLLYVSPQLE